MIPYVKSRAKNGAEKSVGSAKKPFATTRLADDGSFRFELDPPAVGAIAQFQIQTTSTGWATTKRWIDVPAGSNDVHVGDIVLARGGTVRGIVRDLDGKLVEGAIVIVQVVDGEGNWLARGRSDRTAADGDSSCTTFHATRCTSAPTR